MVRKAPMNDSHDGTEARVAGAARANATDDPAMSAGKVADSGAKPQADAVPRGMQPAPEGPEAVARALAAHESYERGRVMQPEEFEEFEQPPSRVIPNAGDATALDETVVIARPSSIPPSANLTEPMQPSGSVAPPSRDPEGYAPAPVALPSIPLDRQNETVPSFDRVNRKWYLQILVGSITLSGLIIVFIWLAFIRAPDDRARELPATPASAPTTTTSSLKVEEALPPNLPPTTRAPTHPPAPSATVTGVSPRPPGPAAPSKGAHPRPPAPPNDEKSPLEYRLPN